jgi:putative oxidoreductase
MKDITAFFRKFEDYSVVLIRMAFGAHLIYFTQDNVFSYSRMLEFSDFLEKYGFPFPLVGAHISVYIQFLCGACFIVGFLSRYAGFIIMVNFTVALAMVHWGQSYEQYYPALQLFIIGIYFMFRGSGPMSIDRLMEKRIAKKYYKGSLFYK